MISLYEQRYYKVKHQVQRATGTFRKGYIFGSKSVANVVVTRLTINQANLAWRKVDFEQTHYIVYIDLRV